MVFKLCIITIELGIEIMISLIGETAGVRDVIDTMRIDNFTKGRKCNRREIIIQYAFY